MSVLGFISKLALYHSGATCFELSPMACRSCFHEPLKNYIQLHSLLLDFMVNATKRFLTMLLLVNGPLNKLSL